MLRCAIRPFAPVGPSFEIVERKTNVRAELGGDARAIDGRREPERAGGGVRDAASASTSATATTAPGAQREAAAHSDAPPRSVTKRPAASGARTAKTTAAMTGETSQEMSSLQEWPLITIRPTKCSPAVTGLKRTRRLPAQPCSALDGSCEGAKQREQHEQAEREAEAVVIEFITLDGVMQGLGSPGTRTATAASSTADGQRPYGRRRADGRRDRGAGAGTTAYLFGTVWTYDKMSAFWPYQPDTDPMAAHLNSTPKYVATRTPSELALPTAPRCSTTAFVPAVQPG